MHEYDKHDETIHLREEWVPVLPIQGLTILNILAIRGMSWHAGK